MDGEVDTLEIVNWIVKGRYGPVARQDAPGRLRRIRERRPLRGDIPGLQWRTEDGLSTPSIRQYESRELIGSVQRSTLAHEIGHAAGLGHVTDNKNLMYENGQSRAANPSLYPIDTILIKSAFFAR